MGTTSEIAILFSILTSLFLAIVYIFYTRYKEGEYDEDYEPKIVGR